MFLLESMTLLQGKNKMNYNDLLDAVEKKNSLISSGIHSPDRLSTGNLVADLVMGGGLLPGLHSIAGPEQSAKTTLSTHILASSIKEQIPLVIAYDAENSIDPIYSGSILKVKSLTDIFGKRDTKGKWIVEPKARYYDKSGLETFFSMLRSLMRRMPDKVFRPEENQWFYVFDNSKLQKQAMDTLNLKPVKSLSGNGLTWFEAESKKAEALVVLDSWPALSPEKFEDEDTEGKGGGMSLKARIMSEELSKTKGPLRKKGIVLFSVNQIRLKPGVMYGCFSYDTLVNLADGTYIEIGKIVREKLDVQVLSYNKDTKQLESKSIKNYFRNGMSKYGEFIKIYFDSFYIKVTKGHKILNADGEEVCADSLKEGDFVFCKHGNFKIEKIETSLIPEEKYDLEIEDNHTYLVGQLGMVVHNSPEYEPGGEALKFSCDCRSQIRARAVPNSWPRGDSSSVCEEESVNNKTDSYSFKHFKNSKNKFGTPFLDGWTRVWISDETGKGRGFDPVYDCYEYLTLTGQLDGNHNKSMSINIDKIKLKLNWKELKQVILAEYENKMTKEVISIFKRNKMKPVKLLKTCFKQVKSGVGNQLRNDSSGIDTSDDVE